MRLPTVATPPSETDVTPSHFGTRHIANRCTGLGFEDVRQIEQILVREVRDGGFDFGNALHCTISAIGKSFLLSIKHVRF